MFYTYMAPLLEGRGAPLEAGLAVFGMASLLGIVLTGRRIDSVLRAMTLTALMAMSLALATWFLPSPGLTLTLTAICVWGISFGGAPALLQTALADRAGSHGDAAQAIFVTLFNLAVAGGGLLGGVLLASPMGITALACAAVILTITAFALAAAKTGAFPAGHRA